MSSTHRSTHSSSSLAAPMRTTPVGGTNFRAFFTKFVKTCFKRRASATTCMLPSFAATVSVGPLRMCPSILKTGSRTLAYKQHGLAFNSSLPTNDLFKSRRLDRSSSMNSKLAAAISRSASALPPVSVGSASRANRNPHTATLSGLRTSWAKKSFMPRSASARTLASRARSFDTLKSVTSCATPTTPLTTPSTPRRVVALTRRCLVSPLFVQNSSS